MDFNCSTAYNGSRRRLTFGRLEIPYIRHNAAEHVAIASTAIFPALTVHKEADLLDDNSQTPRPDPLINDCAAEVSLAWRAVVTRPVVSVVAATVPPVVCAWDASVACLHLQIPTARLQVLICTCTKESGAKPAVASTRLPQFTLSFATLSGAISHLLLLHTGKVGHVQTPEHVVCVGVHLHSITLLGGCFHFPNGVPSIQPTAIITAGHN